MPQTTPAQPKPKRYTDKTGYPSFRGTGVKGVWNLFEHGVTSSLIDTFLECKEQVRLGHVEGWTGAMSWSLEHGNCVHDVFEQAYGFGNTVLASKGRLPAPEEAAVEKWVDDYAAKWLKLNPDPTTEQLQDQELVYGYCKAQLPSYFQRWDGDFTGKYTRQCNTTKPVEYIGAEKEFKVPYTYPDGLQVWMRGKRDVVFLGKDKRERVLDTKNMSIISDQDIIDSFEIDFQQNFYIEARRRETGKMPAGAIKNVLRTPGHRQKKDEGLRDFFGRIKSDLSDPEQWDTKGAEGKKITGWFVRYELTLTSAELDDWVKTQLDPIMQDIRDWFTGKTHHYMTAKHAIGKFGRCKLFNPMVKKDFSRLRQRTKPFPELEGA